MSPFNNKFIPQFEPRVKFKYCWDVFKQMRSGWVGDGSTVQEFEQRLKECADVKYAHTTTSGTVALMLAIESLGLPKGSTILFPAYTFISGANAARFLGYNIKLVDIKEDTLSMDPSKVEITEDISAIIFINHNGYCGPDLDKIKQICQENDLKMIEDSSQCLGIKGNFNTGDISVASFSVPKLITTGQGGAVFTNDEQISEKIWRLRNHGEEWRKEKIHNHLGVNFKFDEIHAAYGLSQLKDFEDILKTKKRIFDHYRKRIQVHDFGYDFNWMVMYRDKKERIDEIIKGLKRNDIQALRYYRPINWNPPYHYCGKKGTYPIAEKVYDEYVYLPSSLVLAKRDIDRICDIIEANGRKIHK